MGHYAPFHGHLCPRPKLNFHPLMSNDQSLTGIRVWAYIYTTFFMSFIEGLLYPLILGPQLHMLVIMKGLLSGYKIDASTIHEA